MEEITKNTSALFLVLLITSAASGQIAAPTKPKQTAGTRIGPHRLGENFNEWLAAEQQTIEGMCNAGVGVVLPHDMQRACIDAKEVNATGEGDLRSNSVELWTFANGKLVYKQSVLDVDIAAEQLRFLKEAYGPPSSIRKIPQQNAFGAKWEDVLMTWHLAGGTTLYLKALGGPKDDLIITFISKDYVDPDSRPRPNPYLPKKPN